MIWEGSTMMKITVGQLKGMVRESVKRELTKEGMVGDAFRELSGRDDHYFEVMSDPQKNIAELKKNKKFYGNKANYEQGGPLRKAAMYVVALMNKNANNYNGVVGYGKGGRVEDVYAAVAKALSAAGPSVSQ